MKVLIKPNLLSSSIHSTAYILLLISMIYRSAPSPILFLALGFAFIQVINLLGTEQSEN